MGIIDEKFSGNKLGFFLQSLLATVAVFIVLLFLDPAVHSAVLPPLGASAFIAFTMPHLKESQPRCLLGGYTIGIIIATICYFLSITQFVTNIEFIANHSNVIFCSVAIGLAIFLMVITNTEHPPAAGMALGLFLNKPDHRTVIVIMVGIISLVVIKSLLRSYLKDLC